MADFRAHLYAALLFCCSALITCDAQKTLLHTLLGITHTRHASIHTISMLLVDFIVLTLTHNLVDLVDFPAPFAY